MEHSRLIALALFLSFNLAAFDVHASDKKARLAAGEILVSSKKVRGFDLPRATVMGVVDATPEKVWGIVSNCADYKRTMERVEQSTLIWKKGNVHRCRVTVDLPFPLSTLTVTTDAVHKVVAGKSWQRSWKLVEGEFVRNNGSWTLAPFNTDASKTLVIYKVHAIPKLPVPDGVLRAAQRKTLPNIIKNLRKQL